MVTTLPLQFGIPGGPELLVILLIAVLLFGANKIPKLARSTGEAMGEFQKGREEVEQELQEMRQGESGASVSDDDVVETTQTNPPNADSAIQADPEADTATDADVDADPGGDVEDDDEPEIAEAETDEETS